MRLLKLVLANAKDLPMSNVKVSVILPSLNVGKYIEKCLDSVMSQTLCDIEILCVDAGSTDGTLEYIEQCARKDGRVHLFNSDKKSYGYQVNLGLDHAVGKYIAIVDTDDFIEPDMYERLYETAEKTEFPDFVMGGSYEFGEINGRLIKWDASGINAPVDKRMDAEGNRQLFFDSVANIWDKIYRTAFIKENQIRLNETKGATYQDTGLKYQTACLAKSMAFTEGAFYDYRIDNPGASMKQNHLWDAIPSEMDFLNQKLGEKISDDPQLAKMMWELRVVLYWWNYDRISPEYRKRFSDEIREELENLKKKDDFMKSLNDELKNRMDQLLATVHGKTEEDCEKEKAESAILEMLHTNRQIYVIVSAGKYTERLLFLQSLIEQKFIVSVCDNDEEKQGKMIDGYEIRSVEESVKDGNEDTVFCIANKNHHEELREQLLRLGVNEDRIISKFPVPSRADLFWIAKRKNNRSLSAY